MKLKIKTIPQSDLDYVEIYAENLKNNNKLFKQQKELIDSQTISGAALTKKRFGSKYEKDFKTNARKHLRKIGFMKD